MIFGCLADRSVLGRAKEPGWGRGLLGWIREGRGGWLAPPTGAGLKVYSISLMIRHGSQASTSPSLAWPLLVLKTPAAGLPSPDRLGRRRVLIFNYLQTAVSGTCAAFAPNFPVYCAFRLLSGMSLAGIVLNCMTLSEGPWRAGRAPPSPSNHPAPQPPSSLLSQPTLLALSLFCPCSQHNSLRPGAHTSLTSSLDMQLQTPLLGPGSSHK